MTTTRKFDSGTIRRLKTTVENLNHPQARKGEQVTIVGGAFTGWIGTVVDSDGIWRTVECGAKQ